MTRIAIVDDHGLLSGLGIPAATELDQATLIHIGQMDIPDRAFGLGVHVGQIAVDPIAIAQAHLVAQGLSVARVNSKKKNENNNNNN